MDKVVGLFDDGEEIIIVGKEVVGGIKFAWALALSSKHPASSGILVLTKWLRHTVKEV